MVIYIALIVLLYFLSLAIWYFFKGIPKKFYLVRGKIIKWEKKRGEGNLIEYFPVVEYKDKDGNKKIVELKNQSVGWIKPLITYKILLLVNKDGTYSFISAISQSLLSLILIIIIVVLISETFVEL